MSLGLSRAMPGSFRQNVRVQPVPFSREEEQRLSALNNRMTKAVKNSNQKRGSRSWFDCFGCSANDKRFPQPAQSPLLVPVKYLALPSPISQTYEGKIEKGLETEEKSSMEKKPNDRKLSQSRFILPTALYQVQNIATKKTVRFNESLNIQEISCVDIQELSKKNEEKEIELLWITDTEDVCLQNDIQESTGMKLEITADSTHVLDRLDKEGSRIKLVIIDLDAKIDNLDLVKAIRSRSFQFPILGISSGSRKERRSYMEAGVTLCIAREILGIEALSARINDLINGS